MANAKGLWELQVVLIGPSGNGRPQALFVSWVILAELWQGPSIDSDGGVFDKARKTTYANHHPRVVQVLPSIPF